MKFSRSIVLMVVTFLSVLAVFPQPNTLPTIPGPPSASLNPNHGNFTLTWNASTGTGGIANYELQRSSDNGFTFITIANPTANSYTEENLPAGKYLYRVRAVDNAGNKSPFSFTRPRGIYTFYEYTSDLRDYSFLSGYVMRKKGAGIWKYLETSEGVYNFSGIDSTIKELEPSGKKLSLLITNVASREPDYIALHPGVTTYSYIDIKTGESVTRAVPWDPYLLERFQTFVKALAEHKVPNAYGGGALVAFRDHPVVANISLGIPGINQGIRERETAFINMPGYTRDNFKNAVITSLHAAVDNIPNKYHYLGFWKVKDNTTSPELWYYLRQAIISEFDGTNNPKVTFWNENLAAKKVSGTVIGSPSCDFAAPLCYSKDYTPIGFQALQGWDCPFANPNATIGATPADGLKYAYDTFGATYFELYVCDLDDQNYWSSFEDWHDRLVNPDFVFVEIASQVDEKTLQPTEFILHQNYPNPFNPETVISYRLPVISKVTLKVFDLLGREIATLVNEQLKPGTYEVEFDGTNYSSGVYLYKLTAGEFSETKRMVLIK